MALHEFGGEGLIAKGLLALLGGSIKDHTLPENRCHKRIGSRLIELFFASAKKCFLSFFAHHHHNSIAREVDLTDFAQLVPHPLKERDGILAQGTKMPEQGPAPRENRGPLSPGRSASVSTHAFAPATTGSAERPRSSTQRSRPARRESASNAVSSLCPPDSSSREQLQRRRGEWDSSWDACA